MSNYWRNYWDQYTSSVENRNPFKQVLRVKNKEAQSPESFERMISYITGLLHLKSDQTVLDLCCGNGLVSNELAKLTMKVTGVDFCESLINSMNENKRGNVDCIVGDVINIDFKPQSYDRIVCAAALQHFSSTEVVRLFGKIHQWLESDGILLVTDILDVDKQWQFYDSTERIKAYFDHISKEEPILGTWFNKLWLTNLANYAGYKSVEIIEQPDDFMYSHYRFDMVCYK